MDTFEKRNTKKKFTLNRRIVLILVVSFLLLAILLLEPILTSRTVYSAFEENYTRQIGNINNQLSLAAIELKKSESSMEQIQKDLKFYLEENKNISQHYYQCSLANIMLNRTFGQMLGELNKSYLDLKRKTDLSLASTTSNFTSEIQDLKKQINKTQKEYDSFINKMDLSICCKKKIDNSNIRYYYVESSSLFCSELRGERLLCSFS